MLHAKFDDLRFGPESIPAGIARDESAMAAVSRGYKPDMRIFEQRRKLEGRKGNEGIVLGGENHGRAAHLIHHAHCARTLIIIGGIAKTAKSRGHDVVKLAHAANQIGRAHV